MASPRRRASASATSAAHSLLHDRMIPVLNRVGTGLKAHPRWTMAAAAMLAVGLGLSLLPGAGLDQPSSPQLTQLQLPGQAVGSLPGNLASQEIQIGVEVAEIPAIGAIIEEGPEEPVWQVVEVRPGQTMERIFREVGLGPRLLHQVVNLDEHTRGLARIRPGDQFAFHLDSEGELLAIRSEFDEESWLFIERNGEGLKTRFEPRALDHRVVEASGVISSSLFNAAKASGLSDNMTMRLANIFGWDIDFALDIRAGDRFALVYEQIWREGEFLRDGPILAARFVNQGDAFEAVRFDAGNGPDYFAPDGRPMRKAFLRAPLNFTRVTSNFNPRRFHPITRQVRPHNGTDYGAPTGTPVWAAGDGRVIRSAYNNANGNYVFIQHGNNVITRYLHLHRRDVREGQRVRQGQTIGTVGATGMATGPHLHYEFLVNGAHRNPRTVDLPAAEPLPADLMEAFLAAGRPLLVRMENADTRGGMMLASSDAASACEGSEAAC